MSASEMAQIALVIAEPDERRKRGIRARQKPRHGLRGCEWIKFKLFEILICINLFYANGYMLLRRCRKETVDCFEKAAICDEVRLVGMQCLFSG